jgi:hypothetical protein
VGECYERRTSVMPQQALALANSELTLVQARLLARRLHDQVGTDSAQFAETAIEQVLARPARNDELTMCCEFLSEQAAFFTANAARLEAVASAPDDASRPSGDARLRAREKLVHVLLNHNDFVTIR